MNHRNEMNRYVLTFMLTAPKNVKAYLDFYFLSKSLCCNVKISKLDSVLASKPKKAI